MSIPVNQENAADGNSEDTTQGQRSSGQDLPDSPHDEERMQSEEIIIDLPDVKDIPGQEHIHVAPLGELADTTISSDDEEGLGLFEEDDDEDDTEIVMGTESDITPLEKSQLEKTDLDMPAGDDSSLREAALDMEDAEGDQLNEGSSGSDVSGADLDVSGAEEDDQNESIGEEDEENNTYSLGSEGNDEG